MFEQSQSVKSKWFLHPVIDWTDGDIFGIISGIIRLTYCSLYDEGYTRIGCIMCPMQKEKQKKAG